MARILMLGAFGQRNLGDEALCAALCEAFADHDVVVASADPEATMALHGCAAIAANPLAVMRQIERSDVVIVGGGTVFKRLHPSSGRRPDALLVNTLALVRWANLRRTPVALIGVGADELTGGSARRLARAIAPRAALMVLRDEESASVLTAAGVTPPFWIGADPAWQVFENVRPLRPVATDDQPTRERARRVTVALSHLADGADHDSPERLAAALAELEAQGWQIALQPWQAGDGDVSIGRRIQALVPTATLVPMPTDLVDAARRFAADDLVVAMRFHALVAAGAAGVRTVVVAHEPKLAGLARRLDQVAVPPDASIAVVASALDWGRHHSPPSSAAVEHEIALAGHTIRLARLVVEGGRLDRPESLPALELSDGGGRW